MALVPFPKKTALPSDPDEDDPDTDDEVDEGATARMSFLDHLDELRKRIIWSVASIGIGFVIAQATGLFDTTSVFAGLVTLGVVGAAINVGLKHAETWLLRWKG